MIGILGQGFSSSSVVKFGGTQATAITLSGTTLITATVPAGALTGLVTVRTGATTLTSNSIFRVTPTLDSFSPTSGPVGTPVVITGTGLLQTTKVTFNRVAVTTFTINSDTQVTADVPTGATTGKIAITTRGGTATSTRSFAVGSPSPTPTPTATATATPTATPTNGNSNAHSYGHGYSHAHSHAHSHGHIHADPYANTYSKASEDHHDKPADAGLDETVQRHYQG